MDQTSFLTHIYHVTISLSNILLDTSISLPHIPGLYFLGLFRNYKKINCNLFAIFFCRVIFSADYNSSYNLYLNHVFHSFNFFLETSLLFIESNYFQIEKFIVDFRFWVIFKFRNIRRGKIGERRYLRLTVN